MFNFISGKDWLLKHAPHKKVNKETIIEEEFFPYGSKIATRRRVRVLKSVRCDDCKEILFYDGLCEEIDL